MPAGRIAIFARGDTQTPVQVPEASRFAVRPICEWTIPIPTEKAVERRRQAQCRDTEKPCPATTTTDYRRKTIRFS